MNRAQPTRGFTLVEVLVALTIFALIATGVQRVASLYFSHFERTQAKTYATWIAQNQLNELRLAERPPAPGENKTDIEFGGANWQILTRVSGTPDPLMRMVEITVFRLDGPQREPRQQLVFNGFMGVN